MGGRQQHLVQMWFENGGRELNEIQGAEQTKIIFDAQSCCRSRKIDETNFPCPSIGNTF